MQPKFVVSRRRVLQSAGALLAAGAGVFRVPSAWAADVSEAMTTLSAYMSGAATMRLPDPVVEKTKHMILDTLAAMISGSELPPGRFAIQFARAYAGNPVATVVGSRRFEIMRTDVKKWTVGAPIQAPLDALDNLLEREKFGAAQVKQVSDARRQNRHVQVGSRRRANDGPGYPP